MHFSYAYLLLALAIVAVWSPPLPRPLKNVELWLLILIAAIAVGSIDRVLKPIALVSISGMLLAGHYSKHGPTTNTRIVATVTAAIVALLLALHVLPGYNNQLVIAPTQITFDAAQYSKYFGFDKGLAGLVMLAYCVRRSTNLAGWTRALYVSVVAAVAILTVLVPPLFLTGNTGFWPKIPAMTFDHLFANLFFTCVAEETFFRGMIQERLHRWCDEHGKPKPYQYVAVVLVAALFSAAHGTPSLGAFMVVLVAGVGYGLAYMKTRTIESAILTHFIVNAAHFHLLTYPYMKP
jgi:uncharacterized protein